MKQTVLRVQTLHDGTLREWLGAGKTYTERPEQQNAIEHAISKTRWYRAYEPLPMSTGLLLQELVNELGLRMVAYFGYSTEPVRHPDCDCSDPYHPDHWATYTLVGIRSRRRDGWWTLYWLDTGLHAVWLVSEVKPEPLPKSITVGCAKEWHELCRCQLGRGRDDQRPCKCTCHGEAPNPLPSAT